MGVIVSVSVTMGVIVPMSVTMGVIVSVSVTMGVIVSVSVAMGVIVSVSVALGVIVSVVVIVTELILLVLRRNGHALTRSSSSRDGSRDRSQYAPNHSEASDCRQSTRCDDSAQRASDSGRATEKRVDNPSSGVLDLLHADLPCRCCVPGEDRVVEVMVFVQLVRGRKTAKAQERQTLHVLEERPQGMRESAIAGRIGDANVKLPVVDDVAFIP